MNKYNNNEYETKTYGALIVLFCFMVFSIIFGAEFLGQYFSKDAVNKLVCIDICIVFIIIAYIIKTKERIYWITSFSYEEAKNMEPEKRRIISKTFWDVFGRNMMVLILYMIAGLVIGTPFILDIIVFVVGVLFAAIRIMVVQSKI